MKALTDEEIIKMDSLNLCEMEIASKQQAWKDRAREILFGSSVDFCNPLHRYRRFIKDYDNRLFNVVAYSEMTAEPLQFVAATCYAYEKITGRQLTP